MASTGRPKSSDKRRVTLRVPEEIAAIFDEAARFDACEHTVIYIRELVRASRRLRRSLDAQHRANTQS